MGFADHSSSILRNNVIFRKARTGHSLRGRLKNEIREVKLKEGRVLVREILSEEEKNRIRRKIKNERGVDTLRVLAMFLLILFCVVIFFYAAASLF